MMTRRSLFQMLAAFGLGSSSLLHSHGVAEEILRSARAAGFRMPLESDPHLRTFMQWPGSQAIYGSAKALAGVRQAIVCIAQAIARFEPVVMLVRPEHQDAAAQALGSAIALWPIEIQDLWCRDSGPSFVVSAKGELAISELNFNGWGNRQNHKDDGRIAKRIAEQMKLPLFDSGIIGEGGGVEVDGAGTILAHESCWINGNRNRQSKAEVERMLLASLGAERVIWAPGVQGEDITDYHIDALARFVKPGQVVIQLPERIDPDDPWSAAAYETYEILKKARDAGGRKLDIVVIDEPDPDEIRSTSETFVSSYVNYYVCNGGLISAQFGDAKADAAAARILTQLYPERALVSLDVDPIGEAGGGIHCATQQQPAVKV